MADEKPLTIPALIAAMKEAGFATVADVERIADQQFTSRNVATQEYFTKVVLDASEAIIKGQDAIYTKLAEHDKRLNQIDMRLEKLEVGQSHINDELQGLKADLSDTPSRTEHNRLKERIIVLENRN